MSSAKSVRERHHTPSNEAILGGDKVYPQGIEHTRTMPANGAFKAPSLERKISKLRRDIVRIDEIFYAFDKNSEDRLLYMGMLERKRDDAVRAAVLQMHTAIEDLLNYYIIQTLLGVKAEGRSATMRTTRGKAIRKMLVGGGSMGFEMKLNFAVILGLVTSRTKDRLIDLNTLRNKCSHNWLLRVPVRAGKRPRQMKPPLLSYQGHDLHNLDVFEDFTSDYGTIYFRLWLSYVGG